MAVQAKNDENFKVVIRVRPELEKNKKNHNFIQNIFVDENQTTVQIRDFYDSHLQDHPKKCSFISSNFINNQQKVQVHQRSQ